MASLMVGSASPLPKSSSPSPSPSSSSTSASLPSPTLTLPSSWTCSARSKELTNEKTTAVDCANWSWIQQREQPKQNRKHQRSRQCWHYSEDRNRTRSALWNDHVVQQPIMTIQQHGPDNVAEQEEGKNEKAFLLNKFQQHIVPFEVGLATATSRTVFEKIEKNQQQVRSGRHLNRNLIHSTLDCLRIRSVPYPQTPLTERIKPKFKVRTKQYKINQIEFISGLVENIQSDLQPVITAAAELSSCSEVVSYTTNTINNNSSRVAFKSFNSCYTQSQGFLTDRINDHKSTLEAPINWHPPIDQHSGKTRNVGKKRSNNYRSKRRNNKISNRHLTLKWTRDSTLWLRFWSHQRHRFLPQKPDGVQDAKRAYNNQTIRLSLADNGPNQWARSAVKSDRCHSYCNYYNFFYYPFDVSDLSNTHQQTSLQCSWTKLRSLTTLIPLQSSAETVACSPNFATNDHQQNCPLLTSPSSPSPSASTNQTNSSPSFSGSDHSGAQTLFASVSSLSFREYYNCDKQYLQQEQPNKISSTTICLSTIMEILPLILLLTMGVIISTTCAKYTFQSSSGVSLHMFHPAHNSTSPATSIMVPIHSQPNASIIEDEKKKDHHLHMMMSDEEAPSSETGGGRSRYATFQSSINYPALDPKRYHQSQGAKASTTSSSVVSQQQQQLFAQLAHQYSAMSLRWLTNSSVTCNDGTKAGYYIRPTPTGSKKWLIFLEGGWYCMSKSACDQRWYKMRDFMTSFRWSQYKTFSGILSSSPSINPYWWNANHVFIPYCSSDIWSGDSSAPPTEMAFLGSRIIDEVIGELIHSPVYQLVDSEFILLAGSSAGAAGVMINLDRVAKMIADAGSSADVRGLADSGWILDNDQPSSMISPSGKMSSAHQHTKLTGCEEGGGDCSPTETIKGAYKLWNSRVPEACASSYPNEPWRCYFGYRLYPTLATPLFVVQFQYDEFQIYMDGMTSRAMNDMEKIRYNRFLAQHMTSTLANVSAVFAPSCMAHILLTKLDWHKVSIRGVTLPEALNCWEQTPVKHDGNNDRFHRYNHHHHHHHHHHHREFPYEPQLSNNQDKKLSWMPPNRSNNRQPNMWLKQKFQNTFPVDEKGKLYKPEYLLSNYKQDDQNELSQFYLPSSSSSSSSTSTSTSSNFFDYLTLKNARSNHSTSGSYYAQQKMDLKPEIEEKIPKSWRANDANVTKLESTSRSSNSISINQTTLSVAESSTDSSQSQAITGLNKKRKKRKRRKGHHHRKSLVAGTTTNTPDTIQNDGYEFSGILSKSLNPYYRASNRGSGIKLYGHQKDQNYWKPMKENSEYWADSYHSIRMCQFRLIDDHQYPERNRECPRLQFNHNTNHHRDKSLR